jgi:hypothetical protein
VDVIHGLRGEVERDGGEVPVNFFAGYRKLRLLNLLTVPSRKRCGFSQEL